MEFKNTLKNLNQLLDVFCKPASKSKAELVKRIIDNKKKKRLMLLEKQKLPKARRKIPKILNFCGTIRKYAEDIFFTHFRMNRDTFKELQKMLKGIWEQSSGRPGHSLEFCLYVTIWRLANMNSFREISDRFCIGKGTVHKIFVKMVKLLGKLKNKVVKFPSNEQTRRKIMENFEKSRAHPFPFVIGCIDATHIKISCPTTDAISYYNRKGYHSILLQGVVDSTLKFTDVFIGYPGRCHDSAMWADSPLQKAIVNKKIEFPEECHLIGDAAYPLQNYLMVPFKDNGFLSAEKKKFNTILSSTRVHVEQAFGLLKKKFRILNHLELQNLSVAKHITMACVVLHNIIIENEGGECELIENVERDNEFPNSSNVQSTENAAEQKRQNPMALICS